VAPTREEVTDDRDLGGRRVAPSFGSLRSSLTGQHLSL